MKDYRDITPGDVISALVVHSLRGFLFGCGFLAALWVFGIEFPA